MSLFDQPDFAGHEQVLFGHDRATGLKAIIAIHDTTLGPALGGTRMWPYASETAALADVLRLARGMTYKSALAGLPLGGGKAVIIGDSRRDKTEALLRAYGRLVDQLDGRYVTAEDVGIGVDDIEIVARETRHVVGRRATSGDPSPFTALGVVQGLRAAVRHRLGLDQLDGLRVAIQGLGHVGWPVAEMLAGAGCVLTVADIDPAKVQAAAEAFGASPAAIDRIHAAAVDVLAPCALGATLNDATIPDIRAAVIAGCANNQLAEPRHGEVLAARGILYAPDYVINAGGVINISLERDGYDGDAARAKVLRIGDTLDDLFARAEREGLAPARMADRLAEEILRKGRRNGHGRDPRRSTPPIQAPLGLALTH